MTSVGLSIESSRPSVDIYPSSFGGVNLQQVSPQNTLEAAAAAARSLETPTFDISAQLAVGLSKSAPKHGSEFRQMDERMHNFHMSSQPQQSPISQHLPGAR